jgi:hypothetical protein
VFLAGADRTAPSLTSAISSGLGAGRSDHERLGPGITDPAAGRYALDQIPGVIAFGPLSVNVHRFVDALSMLPIWLKFRPSNETDGVTIFEQQRTP